MHFNPADVIFIPLPSTDKIPLLEQRAGNRQIIVDIGCGKGRFLLQMAERNPACFFIGIDILRKRLQKIEQKAKKANLSNIILVNCEAAYCIAYLMPDNAVSTYYAFFPDPWPKRKHAPRRLFSKEILPDIWRTMKENAIIHIATDDNNYYQQILFLFSKSELFLSVAPYFPPQECKSDFELEFETKYKPIFRCSFQKYLRINKRNENFSAMNRCLFYNKILAFYIVAILILILSPNGKTAENSEIKTATTLHKSYVRSNNIQKKAEENLKQWQSIIDAVKSGDNSIEITPEDSEKIIRLLKIIREHKENQLQILASWNELYQKKYGNINEFNPETFNNTNSLKENISADKPVKSTPDRKSVHPVPSISNAPAILQTTTFSADNKKEDKTTYQMTVPSTSVITPAKKTTHPEIITSTIPNETANTNIPTPHPKNIPNDIEVPTPKEKLQQQNFVSPQKNMSPDEFFNALKNNDPEAWNIFKELTDKAGTENQ